jgi:iron complex transport system substrate-binding protein
LFSCNSSSTHSKNTQEIKQFLSQKQPSKTDLHHAKGFTIIDYIDFKIIKVFNPWQSAKNIEYTYLLASKLTSIPDSLQSAVKIITPVSRIICLSTTHIAMISEIGESDKICGLSGAQFVYNKQLKSRIKEGKIIDIGSSDNLNYEQIISLKPDFVMVYGVGEESIGFTRKLTEFGIPYIFNADYLEETPLGKAEWIKFVAAFFDKDSIATEKFKRIENEYQKLCTVAQKLENRPKILCNIPYKGVWYVPGGKSYLAQLIHDAGGDYIWKTEPTRESMPINFETVFSLSQNADIWIHTGTANTKDEVLGEDVRLRLFKPFKDNRIFNNNARQNENGGNDYWESGFVNPHIILKDLITIFHPDLFPEGELVYYKKL